MTTKIKRQRTIEMTLSVEEASLVALFLQINCINEKCPYVDRCKWTGNMRCEEIAEQIEECVEEEQE